jgi:hypothetical protein
MIDFNEWCLSPGLLQQNLLENVKEIKDYFDGFLTIPVSLYNNEVVIARSMRTDKSDFNQVVEFVKKLKQENKKIFLYQLSECSVDGNSQYVLRYGKL